MPFLFGMIISFVGQLPLGFINLLIIDVAVKKNNQAAILFSIGIVLVEAFYLSIILFGVRWLNTFQQFFSIISIFTTICFVTLGVLYFKNGNSQRLATPKNSYLFKRVPLVNGLIVSLLNIVQIPFWILWTTYLINSSYMNDNLVHNVQLVIGAVIGTFVCLLGYIYLGKQIVIKWPIINRNFHFIMAIFFFLAAISQTIQLIKKH
ncbi:MAG: LysE family transporter [Chitinophagaceae bacterium]